MCNEKIKETCYKKDSCEICEEAYQQGRADAFEKIIKLAHEDVTTGNMIISLADVEKEIKEQKNDNR